MQVAHGVLVPGVLLRDSIVADAERDVRGVAAAILGPVTALSMAAGMEQLQAARKRHRRAVDAALAAEAVCARIGLHVRQVLP